MREVYCHRDYAREVYLSRVLAKAVYYFRILRSQYTPLAKNAMAVYSPREGRYLLAELDPSSQ